jgi:hypothetical protein
MTSEAKTGISVTSRKRSARGRPADNGALSPAERQQRRRDRKVVQQVKWAASLVRAREEGDWDAVARVAGEIAKA